MSDNNEIVNERLANLLRLDARTILKSHKQDYIELHLLIEGYKPSCTGCSAKSRLSAWRNKLSKNNIIKIKEVMSTDNTFILKKKHPRVSIPFTGTVITQNSKDTTVQYYLDGAKDDAELKRRQDFFDVLPTKVKEIKVKDAEAIAETPKEVVEPTKKTTKKRTKRTNKK